MVCKRGCRKLQQAGWHRRKNTSCPSNIGTGFYFVREGNNEKQTMAPYVLNKTKNDERKEGKNT